VTTAAHAAYDRGARAYDAVWSPVILPPAQSVVRGLELGDARTVVDIGAGTGALGAELRRSAPDALVVSLDRSAAMLRFAAERRAVTAVLADASFLPLRPESVDAALLAYVLFHLPDPASALRGVAGALRTCGRLGTVTWGQEWPSRASVLWEEWLDELSVPSIGATGCHEGLSSPHDVAALLETTGFRCRRAWVEGVAATFERDAFARLRLTHGRSAARLALLDPRQRRAVSAELRRRLTQLTAADLGYRGEVVCAIAWRP
jgi:ubiquinone/menaquinone biosynthesis C-methylase UbiE